MSLPINNKKTGNLAGKATGAAGKGSKFIKQAAGAKPVGATKKVRSTGANRGS